MNRRGNLKKKIKKKIGTLDGNVEWAATLSTGTYCTTAVHTDNQV